MAGGPLAHHVAQGDRVTVVIATTGVRSHHWALAEDKRQAGADLGTAPFEGRPSSFVQGFAARSTTLVPARSHTSW